MATYNHRKHLKRLRETKRASGTGLSAGKKAWGGLGLVLILTVLALGVAVPQSWTAVHLPPLSQSDYRLGLDLLGGTHLVYEADMSQIPVTDRGEALDGVRDVIERRVNAYGVSEPVVQTITSGATHRVIVELAGVTNVTEAIDLIGETPILEFKEPGEDPSALDEEETTKLDEAQTADKARADDLLAQVKKTGQFPEDVTVETIPIATPAHYEYGPLVSYIVNNKVRVGGAFVEEAGANYNVTRFDGTQQDEQWLTSQILICFEGKISCQNPISEIEATIQAQKALEGLTAENFAERVTEFSTDPTGAQNGGDLSWIQPGVMPEALELNLRALAVGGVSTQVAESDYGYHIFFKREQKALKTYQLTRTLVPKTTASDLNPEAAGWKNTALSGKQLDGAIVEFTQTGQPYIGLNFDKEGGDLFGEITARLVGQPIGIFLDGQLISAPRVNEAIYGGQAQISGSFTIDEAKLLAQRLNAGALPVPIDLLSQQTVGPTLGQASLDRSMTAGMIGFLLVAIFMMLYYRLPGLLAVLALGVYTLLNLMAYKLFGVTMTLAGIAGFILSVGMAVDANVLIFERLKEELNAGRDLSRAVEEAFIRAWTSIRDGNVTTLIAATILFTFSTSFVKGFAVTLAIGVLLSMFSAIVVTKSFLRVAGRIPFLRNKFLYGASSKSHL